MYSFIIIIFINVAFPIYAVKVLDWNLATIVFLYYLEFGISILFSLLKAFFTDPSGVMVNGRPMRDSIANRIGVVLVAGFIYLIFYAVAGILILKNFDFATIQIEEVGVPLLAFAGVEGFNVFLFFKNKDYIRFGNKGLGRVILKSHIKLILLTATFALAKDKISLESYTFIIFVVIKILVDLLASWVEKVPSDAEQKS